MRTRDMKLLNYGIDKEEEKRLRILAKDKENAPLVRVASEESNQGIADALFASLTSGKGYRSLPEASWMVTEDDFYAYRRRALYIFKLLLLGRSVEAQKNADSQISD